MDGSWMGQRPYSVTFATSTKPGRVGSYDEPGNKVNWGQNRRPGSRSRGRCHGKESLYRLITWIRVADRASGRPSGSRHDHRPPDPPHTLRQLDLADDTLAGLSMLVGVRRRPGRQGHQDRQPHPRPVPLRRTDRHQQGRASTGQLRVLDQERARGPHRHRTQNALFLAVFAALRDPVSRAAQGNANSLRYMEPTPQSKYGYVRFYNSDGQPIA